MSALVREAGHGDGPAIADCWLDAGRHYAELDSVRFRVPDSTGLAEWFEATLDRRAGGGVVLVAESGGEVVGFCTARIEPPAGEPWRQLQQHLAVTRVFVDALAVRASARRTGAGTALMRAAEAWGRERGARLLLVEGFVEGSTALPFYERRLGYRRRSIRFEREL